MNIVKLQNDLKDLSDRQLYDTMQGGAAPQYLVLGEMQRRKKMRQEAQSQPQQPTSVAEDIMAPPQQPQGIAAMPQNPMMQMASGGIVGFAAGKQVSAYAKGSQEGCWKDPATGKMDCPGKPDVRMPKKLAEGGAIGFADQGYVDPRLLMLDPEEREKIMREIESSDRQLTDEGEIVTSKKGALGRFQVMPATAAQPGYGMKNIFELADERGISNYGEGEDEAARLLAIPELNADMGREYKRGLVDMFGEQGAVPAYNMGPGAYKKFLAGQQGMPEETQDYVAKTNEGIERILASRNADQTIADLGESRMALEGGERFPTLQPSGMPIADADPADIAEYLRAEEDAANVAKALRREAAENDMATQERMQMGNEGDPNKLEDAFYSSPKGSGLMTLMEQQQMKGDLTDMSTSPQREDAYMKYLDLTERGLYDGTFEQFYGEYLSAAGPEFVDAYEASQAGLPAETRPPVIAPKAEGIQTQLPDDMPPTPPVVSDGRTELSKRLLEGFGGPASEQELKDIRARNRAEYGIDDFDRMIRDSGEAPAPEKAPEQSMQRLSAEETLKLSDRIQRELPPPPEDDPDALASWSREAAKLFGDDPTDAAVNAMVTMYGLGVAKKILGALGKGEKWVRSKLVKVPKDYKGLGSVTKGGKPYKNKSWAETAAKELEKATGKAHKVVKSGDGFKVIPTAKAAYGPAATAVGKGLKAVALPAAMTGMYAANEWRKMTPEEQQQAIDSFSRVFGSSEESTPAKTAEGIEQLGPTKAAAEKLKAEQAQETRKAKLMEGVSSVKTGGAATTDTGGAAPAGSFYDRLNTAIAERDDNSFNKALMAAGLGMMASKDTSFMGAVGEGGLKGLSAYTKLTEAEKDRQIKMLKEMADIEAAKASAGYKSSQASLARTNAVLSAQKEVAKMFDGAAGLATQKKIKAIMKQQGKDPEDQELYRQYEEAYKQKLLQQKIQEATIIAQSMPMI